MTAMSDRDGLIWMDGEMVPWRDAKIHVLTHTLHYGMGVFEGVRAYKTPQGPAIFRLEDHTKRLFNSAKIMNMDIRFSQEEINAAQKACVRENNLESAYLRPMVFYGSEGMGLRADNLQTHVMIAAWEWANLSGRSKIWQRASYVGLVGAILGLAAYTTHNFDNFIRLYLKTLIIIPLNSIKWKKPF